ncbi:hypothetical protein SAPIO_CDS6826 [Scedosporium apiospermum]|uniref:Uncharacterized protein n=1 Tax=Pseudallescheria apiosperma TaxID=563466 RepID=A0A084G2V5_PSEDA|nr:uncharacterized protein SAPIO_CDS6826 [Scedosporium apiospermum]KEZ41667.1 hypothetical protein SAPIO_CDS6826 [Scedosporium apiospermum]
MADNNASPSAAKPADIPSTPAAKPAGNASSQAVKPAAGPTPTQRELELIYLAFQSIKDASIDYTKFAELGGFTTVASGRASWCAIKRKYFKDAEGGASETTTPVKKTPTKGRKRKAAADTAEENAGEAEGEAATGSAKKATPRGRKRKTSPLEGKSTAASARKSAATKKAANQAAEVTATAETGGAFKDAKDDEKAENASKDDGKSVQDDEKSAEGDEKPAEDEADGETAQQDI